MALALGMNPVTCWHVGITLSRTRRSQSCSDVSCVAPSCRSTRHSELRCRMYSAQVNLRLLPDLTLRWCRERLPGWLAPDVAAQHSRGKQRRSVPSPTAWKRRLPCAGNCVRYPARTRSLARVKTSRTQACRATQAGPTQSCRRDAAWVHARGASAVRQSNIFWDGNLSPYGSLFFLCHFKRFALRVKE